MADQLTPEEKLLNVIQKGGASAGMIGSTPSDEDPLAAESDAIHEVTAPHEHFTGVGVVIWSLILVAVLLGAAIVWEILRAPAAPIEPGRGPSELNLGAGKVYVFPDYVQVVAEIQKIFDAPMQGTSGREPPPDPPWALYIKRNFNWVGISEVTDSGTGQVTLEAIVMDRKTKKLQLLRQGQRLHINAGGSGSPTEDVAVEQVLADKLAFSSGGHEVTLKKQ